MKKNKRGIMKERMTYPAILAPKMTSGKNIDRV